MLISSFQYMRTDFYYKSWNTILKCNLLINTIIYKELGYQSCYKCYCNSKSEATSWTIKCPPKTQW